MFDTDNDGGVIVDELVTTLDGFEKMGAMGMGGPPNAAPAAENPMSAMVRAAKRFAPTLHQLMDADGSGKLSKEELKWVTSTHETFKKAGVLKKLIEGIFVKIDADADEVLSEAELRAAIGGERSSSSRRIASFLMRSARTGSHFTNATRTLRLDAHISSRRAPTSIQPHHTCQAAGGRCCRRNVAACIVFRRGT